MPTTKIFNNKRYTLHRKTGYSIWDIPSVVIKLKKNGWWVTSVHGGKGRDHRYYIYKRRKK